MNSWDIIQYLVECEEMSKEEAESKDFTLEELYVLNGKAERYFKKIWNEV